MRSISVALAIGVLAAGRAHVSGAAAAGLLGFGDLPAGPARRSHGASLYDTWGLIDIARGDLTAASAKLAEARRLDPERTL